MYGRPRQFFGGVAGGVFVIFLALAFISGHFFLPLLFVGLAFAALLGSLAGGNSRSTYGGVMGFIWMLGLAAIFTFNFWWPGILILVGISAIAGTVFRPMMSGSMRANAPQQPYYQPFQPQQPYYQPSQTPQQPEQAPYQPYQEGYQPPQQQEGYQEGGKAHPYPQQQEANAQDYEQPRAQYPQELPPQQQ
jgi:hypothetical protein